MTITVAGLADYPVKSLAGRSLGEMRVGPLGPEGDRRWMVVDTRGRFLTQRGCSRLCLIHAEPVAEGLRLRAADADELSVAVPGGGARELQVSVWNDSVKALDAGEPAAQWLSRFLGRDVRLCYLPAENARAVDAAYSREGDRFGFADGFPFLLISVSSLNEVSRTVGQELSAARFRPNIIVDGAEPFAEERWNTLRIGELDFDVAKPCSRCVIPSIDPATGVRQRAVAEGLKHYRHADGKIYFGQNLIHRGSGVIRVGDRIEIIR